MDQLSIAFIGLAQNVALLLASALLFDVFASRWRTGRLYILQKIGVGLVLGVIGMLVMLTPWTFAPGVVFDTRSVLIGTTGLFFGTIPAVMTMAMTMALRLYQGGPGAWTGVYVILASGIIGIAWGYRRRGRLEDVSWGELYGFGLTIHIVMLALFFTFPRDIALQVIPKITLPVLVIHPLGTALLGSLMVRRLAREKAEEELQEAKQLLEDVLDAVSDVIGIQNPDRTIVRYNRAGYELLGLTREDVVDKACYSLLGRVKPCETCATARALKSRRLETIEFFVPELGRHLLCRSNPLFDEKGEVRLIIEQLHDITGRRQAEEEREKLQAQLNQAQKMETVGRLAGGVAHDFNNMMAVILGHTELALAGMDPKQPIHSDLQQIRGAAERCAALTGQLLAFARKQTVAPKILDLNETVAGILEMLRRLIGEHIDLVWVPAHDLWPVRMDPSQIDQVMTNLCVNARDAIGDIGRITIETGKASFDEAHCAEHTGFFPGEYVLLTVSDNGCGMDRETVDKLFEPFFTTKEVGKGSGLGLATVYGIVRQNNGFIQVDSEPNRGTTFRIYLPRHTAGPGRMPTADARTPAASGHETILLVEDEPAMLHMTRMMLEHRGYKVLAAASPGEAMTLALENQGDVHLLMTDVVMPEMNGRDLAEKLSSLNPGLRCLFMSGYTADVIAHHGVLDEGVHFIEKPFLLEDLSAKVRETLDASGPSSPENNESDDGQNAMAPAIGAQRVSTRG